MNSESNNNNDKKITKLDKDNNFRVNIIIYK